MWLHRYVLYRLHYCPVLILTVFHCALFKTRHKLRAEIIQLASQLSRPHFYLFVLGGGGDSPHTFAKRLAQNDLGNRNCALTLHNGISVTRGYTCRLKIHEQNKSIARATGHLYTYTPNLKWFERSNLSELKMWRFWTPRHRVSDYIRAYCAKYQNIFSH